MDWWTRNEAVCSRLPTLLLRHVRGPHDDECLWHLGAVTPDLWPILNRSNTAYSERQHRKNLFHPEGTHCQSIEDTSWPVGDDSQFGRGLRWSDATKPATSTPTRSAPPKVTPRTGSSDVKSRAPSTQPVPGKRSSGTKWMLRLLRAARKLAGLAAGSPGMSPARRGSAAPSRVGLVGRFWQSLRVFSHQHKSHSVGVRLPILMRISGRNSPGLSKQTRLTVRQNGT
jgi:hypothetical protein